MKQSPQSTVLVDIKQIAQIQLKWFKRTSRGTKL